MIAGRLPNPSMNLDAPRARELGSFFAGFFSGLPVDADPASRESVERAKLNLSKLDAVGFVESMPDFQDKLRKALSVRIRIGHENKVAVNFRQTRFEAAGDFIVNNMYKNGTYIRFNPTWHVEDSAWKAGHIHNILRTNGVSFHSAAEVGCGAGSILKELSRSYEDAEFYGYEISPDAMKLWINDNPRVRFRSRDFHAEERNFDVLLVIDVLEHIEDYIGFLRRIRDRATFFVFHIPLELSVQQVIRDIQLHTRATYGHIHYFSKATALATLVDTGFHVLDHFYTNASKQYVSIHRNFRMRMANIARDILFSFSPNLTVKLLGGYELMVLAKAHA